MKTSGNGVIVMRKMTLEEIESRVRAKRRETDYAVSVFRSESKTEGWNMRRTRPRNPDEIEALNQLARQQYLDAVKNGLIQYDREKRVLTIAKYSRS